MKRIAALMFVLLIWNFCSAQVTMQPLPLNEWMVNPVQLIKTDFINPGSPVKGRIQAEIKSKSGRTLLTVTSASIYIQSGFMHYEPTMVNNAVYAPTDEGTYLRNFSILPTGEYNVCYTLSMDQTTEPMQNLCNTISVTSLHSMMLISPFDGEELETKNPVLVWSLISSGLTTSDGSHYEMLIANYDKKMSKERALLNKPLLHINDLNSFQVLYSRKEICMAGCESS
jgi:hypothetical protein